MKHLLSSRYLSSTADPHAALARDVAIVGGVIGVEGNQIDQQVASLEALVTQQRKAQCRMTKVLRDAEIRHRAVSILFLFYSIFCYKKYDLQMQISILLENQFLLFGNDEFIL